MTAPDVDLDLFDAALARRATGLLRAFNLAGVLHAADVHVALRLGGLGRTDDEEVLLATALAVRAPRLGHTCVDLTTIHATATTETDDADPPALPWPEPTAWVGAVVDSALVGEDRPLRLNGTLLYLDRYWSDERQVARDLWALADAPAGDVDTAQLRAELGRLFPATGQPDLQSLAAASAVLRRFSVIAGGPGTGKTTTVARVLALLDALALAAGNPLPLAALAAPTGKAAARLEEAVHEQAAHLPVGSDERVRLLRLEGVTLHRLLGFRPGNRARFRHDRLNRLPHDVIVVDETSMVSLSMMARLVESVRPDARLILVGDPEQLASVEAGSVLGGIVGPTGRHLRMRPSARQALADVGWPGVPALAPPTVGPRTTPIGDGIVVLDRVHRFGGAIADLATATRRGDADAVVWLLRRGGSDVAWIETDVVDDDALLAPVRGAAVQQGRRVLEAARAGQGRAAIDALGGFRLLCAHRRGPAGADRWMRVVERWLAAEVDGFAQGGEWYVGRPLMVTQNDYSLRLYNGDTGVVVVASAGRVVAAFERGAGVLSVSPTRLASVETPYAVTVHKAQGSQFAVAAALLPGPESPLLTRELFYTAVTRARQRLWVVGTEQSVRTAVDRPIARSSGLRQALWDA